MTVPEEGVPTALPEDLFLDIDRSSPIPLYYQMAKMLGAY